MSTSDNIPVIERNIPVSQTIRYRGREYGCSGPRIGLEYQPYPAFNTAMMYARNWRKSMQNTHISIVVKAISGEKVVGYFVYVAPRKWVMKLK